MSIADDPEARGDPPRPFAAETSLPFKTNFEWLVDELKYSNIFMH